MGGFMNTNVDKSDLNVSLFIAIGNNDSKLTKKALENGADANANFSCGITPLMSIENDNIWIAKLLVQHNANILAVSDNGYTPLIANASVGHIRVVNYLLTMILHTPEINHQNNEGWSALHFAAKNGYVSIIEGLISNNANVEIRNNKNFTPLMLAILENEIEAAKAILKGMKCSYMLKSDKEFFLDSIKEEKKRRNVEKLLEKLHL